MTQLPPIPITRGKKGHIIDDGQIRTFLIEDEIVRPETNNPKKVIYLQKIKYDDNQERFFRLAYYIIGKNNKRMAGKWVFGQYATMFPAEDMAFLFHEVILRGWS